MKWADSLWEIAESRRLRRAVFCAEQQVFAHDDLDAVDAHAQPLVALSQLGGMPDQVVGTVRIHRDADKGDEGVWWARALRCTRAFASMAASA